MFGPSATSLIACMRSSKLRLFPLSAVLLVAASLLYPAIVYVGRTIVPPPAFVNPVDEPLSAITDPIVIAPSALVLF